ncbi:hypothetical protein [Porphyromonas sp. HMSC065F10]|uniref:hypothetical protein n=1 Tax=Porphyromonas sp. HMSC065F10 TaxID=1739394 RepID=UPI0011D0F15C|nr:hypothetical protein [Porphyromonas sp. HMSC065F10]
MKLQSRRGWHYSPKGIKLLMVTHLSDTEATPLTVKSGERCTPTGVLAPKASVIREAVTDVQSPCLPSRPLAGRRADISNAGDPQGVEG